jgi:FkbM family methyltransferase
LKTLQKAVFDNLLNRQPVTLVDIGARGGPSSNWRSHPNLFVVGFEPDPNEHRQLEDAAGPNERYLNAALWDRPSNLELNLTKSPGSSSILTPNRAFLDQFPDHERFEVVERTTVQTDTLDHQLSINGIRDVDFIKADTQGTELRVLKGATETLSSVIGIELEVEFSEMYKEQPLFSDVDPFVRDSGFALFDLRTHYWKRSRGVEYGGSKGQLVFADALYLRIADSFNAVLSNTDPDKREAQLARALSICVVYGYVDYALELLAAVSDICHPDTYRLLLDALTSSEKGRGFCIPAFRGSRRVAAAVHALYKSFRSGPSWADSARTLGNL